MAFFVWHTPSLFAKTSVFIDAGHGGMNEGAIGVEGLKEKEVVLDIALKLQRYLQKDRRFVVFMSRDDDRFLGLRERTRRANALGVDIFLSIHANASVSEKPHGVEVWALAATSARDEGLDIVAREEGTRHVETRNTDQLSAVLHGLKLAGSRQIFRENLFWLEPPFWRYGRF